MPAVYIVGCREGVATSKTKSELLFGRVVVSTTVLDEWMTGLVKILSKASLV